VESWTDPYGDQVTPTSYVIYRSLETQGRANTAQRLAVAYQPAPTTCQRADGSDSNTGACVRFVDTGAGAQLITPSILSGSAVAGTGPAAGTYSYRLSAYSTGMSNVAASGYDWAVTLPGSTSYRLSWEHNAASAGYLVYRRLGTGAWTCLSAVDASASPAARRHLPRQRHDPGWLRRPDDADDDRPASATR